MRKMSTLAVCLSLAACTYSTQQPVAKQSWDIDSQRSSISFVSVKAVHVGEAHVFENFSGSLSSEGALSVSIDLHSVNTAVPIRDERMRDNLFSQPNANLSAKIDMDLLKASAANSTQRMQIQSELTLNNSTSQQSLDVFVTKLGDSQGFVVSTAKPVMLNANSLGLGAGVEMLREVVGLPSISQSVPLVFSVRLE